MRSLRLVKFAVLSIALSLTACSSSADVEPPVEVDVVETDRFVLTLIDRVDPAPELTQQVGQEAMQGHFANMTRLAEEGKLLVAGPFGRGHVPAAPALAGLFAWNTGKISDAIQWSASDPAAIAGIFRFRHFVAELPVAVREVPELDKALLETLPEDQARNPGATVRPYVVAIGRSPTAVIPEDLDDSVVVLRGARNDGAPVLLLDMQTAEEAAAVLPEGFLLRSWFSSKVLKDLD